MSNVISIAFVFSKPIFTIYWSVNEIIEHRVIDFPVLFRNEIRKKVCSDFLILFASDTQQYKQ